MNYLKVSRLFRREPEPQRDPETVDAAQVRRFVLRALAKIEAGTATDIEKADQALSEIRQTAARMAAGLAAHRSNVVRLAIDIQALRPQQARQ